MSHRLGLRMGRMWSMFMDLSLWYYTPPWMKFVKFFYIPSLLLLSVLLPFLILFLILHRRIRSSPLFFTSLKLLVRLWGFLSGQEVYLVQWASLGEQHTLLPALTLRLWKEVDSLRRCACKAYLVTWTRAMTTATPKYTWFPSHRVYLCGRGENTLKIWKCPSCDFKKKQQNYKVEVFPHLF